jgi:hypothetical protein
MVSAADSFGRNLGFLDRPSRPIGLLDVKDPTLSRQSAHGWR